MSGENASLTNPSYSWLNQGRFAAVHVRQIYRIAGFKRAYLQTDFAD
jgi:hypothetical protein